VSIGVLYADPKFEVSSGVFFSTLPNRSFSNQTAVVQNPGSVPTPGNVYISETRMLPTALPYVAANYRIGHDFSISNSRRMALYGTGAIAVSAYNSSAEYAAGLSLSWRSLMFSVLGHVGRETMLTQGEYVNQVLCSASPSATATSNPPKCSSPPNPTTEHVWTGRIAFGLGIRAPTTFGSAGGH
jgi:hypothetical protein